VSEPLGPLDPLGPDGGKKAAPAKGGAAGPGLPPRPRRLAAIGLESELTLVVDGRKTKPEKVFGDPRSFTPRCCSTCPTRPAAYDDVGRLCRWDDLFPERALSRSLYERVLIHAIAGDLLRRNGRSWRPVGMHGWSEVVFERVPDGTRRTVPIDDLVRHLDEWKAGGRGPGDREKRPSRPARRRGPRPPRPPR